MRTFAKLVEVEVKDGKLGKEKRPSVKEFVRLLFKQGVRKEVEDNLDGSVDFKFYTRVFGKKKRLETRKGLSP